MIKYQKIYPSIEIEETDIIRDGNKENVLKFNTALRKKHKGKWYLWLFKKQYINLLICERLNALNQLHAEVYRCQLLGKVNLKIGSCMIFPLDSNQEEEEDRLKKTIYKYE